MEKEKEEEEEEEEEEAGGEGEVNLGEELRTITYQRQHLSRKIARRPFSVCLFNFTIFHGTRPDVWH